MNKKQKNTFAMSCVFWGLMLIVLTATNGFAQTCGNGVVEAGEQCDDGNTSGGCCTAQCTFAEADSTCYDGNPNTIDSCNAAGVCVGRYQTTTCGACRNPSDAQDTSYCDLTTNQCVRQTASCAPFFIEADGTENKCQPNNGRDPATGQCLYSPKQCTATGCLETVCNPTSGACEIAPNTLKSLFVCQGNDNACSSPADGCPSNPCVAQSCRPDPNNNRPNCEFNAFLDCNAQPSSCQAGVPASTTVNSLSCQPGNGCVYTVTSCAPPSNPCEVLVRDGNASGCCTYQPRDCAAEFGNNPNFTYACDPTATNGVCQATPNSNQAPSITGGNVSRQQNAGASNSMITTVGDAEDATNSLSVSVNNSSSASVNGVTVSNIQVAANGNVSADISAACGATSVSFTLKVTDSGGSMTTAMLNVTVTNETTPPVINVPSDITVNLAPNSPATSAIVNFNPTATDNCDTNPTVTASPASGSAFSVGTTTVNVTATDALGNQSTGSFTVTVRYNFAGLFNPIENLPVVNQANAGQAIPVKFSLSGNKGLNIFAVGFPASQQIACTDGSPISTVDETVNAGGSSLTYDATTDRYNYVWKTDKAWKGTCRLLIIRLNDGSNHIAQFRFK